MTFFVLRSSPDSEASQVLRCTSYRPKLWGSSCINNTTEVVRCYVLPFCIDASVLGTEKHLVVDNGFSWTTFVPDVLHYTGEIKHCDDKCFDSLLKLGGIKIDPKPPKQFVTAIEPLVSGSNHDGGVPWRLMLPERAHRTFTRRLVDELVASMDKLPIDYFSDTWVPGNHILRALERAKVDGEAWRVLVAANVGNIHVVKTFKPDADGMTGPIVYDRFGTLTGRLTVAQGPNILTLKKQYRDMFVPSDPEGAVVYLDFAGLEARVLLYEAGRRCDDPDLYGVIAKELGYSRQAVKGAVICELYGSSKWALGETLGISGKELTTFTRKIKSHFNTGQLLKRIKRQFVETGKIINRYGRPVIVDEPMDHVMVNYYAQSSGADVVLQGFSEFIKRVPNVRPLFLIHDAMILDVPKASLHLIEGIHWLTVKGYVQPFCLKGERLATAT